MNVQHSSRSDSWRTPPEILERVRRVLGQIDLDPASDPEANKAVRADAILTVADDGLAARWPGGTVYLNPPGGKRGNKSMTALFWERLMVHRDLGQIRHAIFMAFSLEALQTTQSSGPGRRMVDFPFCVPKRRIRFVHPGGLAKAAPSHSNAIVYVPGTIDESAKFLAEFYEIGAVANMHTL